MMMNTKTYTIELTEFELNTVKSLVKAEYNRDKIRFENRYTDDFDKDILKDSMCILNHIITKIDRTINSTDILHNGE